MRRRGAGARTRERKVRALRRWERRGSSSAVGLRSLGLSSEGVRVAQGLLEGNKCKYV
jgi:hypothetical protein